MPALAIDPTAPPPGGYDGVASSSGGLLSADGNATSFMSQLAEASRESSPATAQPFSAPQSLPPINGSPLSSVGARLNVAPNLGQTPTTPGEATATAGSRVIEGRETIHSPSTPIAASIDRKPDVVTDHDPQDQGGLPTPVPGHSPTPSDATARRPATQTPHDTDSPPADPAAAAMLASGLTPQGAPPPITGPDVLIAQPSEKGTKPSSTSGDAGDNAVIASVSSAASASSSGSMASDAAVRAAGTAGIVSGASADPVSNASVADVASARPAPTFAGAVTSPGETHSRTPSSKPDQSSASFQDDLQTAASPSGIPAVAGASASSIQDLVVPDAVQTAMLGRDGTSSTAMQTTLVTNLPSEPNAAQLDTSGALGQVGASLLTLASSADGARQISVSLHPKELGAVRVQLELAPDGTAKILVAASEPGTLRSLMANQEHLHAALDAASVSTEGRHLSFELESASATTHGSPDDPGGSGTSPAPDGQASANMSGSSQFGRQSQGSPGNGNASRDSPGSVGNQGNSAGSPLQAVSTFTARLLPTGSINITA